jgi:hypothetical protein
MNLQADWGYILEVAERRLRNNRTHRHIVSEKGRLEIIGAAGEVAARRFLGLPEKLHNHFDGGVDLNWRGYRVDVKSTAISDHLGKQYLQYPEYKWINADIILMMGIDLDRQEATVIGFATCAAPIAAPYGYRWPRWAPKAKPVLSAECLTRNTPGWISGRDLAATAVFSIRLAGYNLKPS